MERCSSREVKPGWARLGTGLFFSVILLVIFLIDCSPANALPAFARKYGLPCSACHQAWPMLSPFGQQFKDNGYQLGNDRDAPIFQQAAYWPVTFRITPIWHRESTSKAAVDGTNGYSGNEAPVTAHGFDLSGLDFHTGGTLANNISFYCLPSSDPTASFHFESVWARLDNVGGSSWFNIKLGKFELDNLLSEKRILTLTNVGGVYENYHFQPFSQPGVPENYVFGIGDNQLGVELMGHSANDYTRYSVSLLSQNDGQVNLPTSRAYGAYLTASQAFQIGGLNNLGLERVGVFAYLGQAPTYFQYSVTSTTPIGFDSTTNSPIYGPTSGVPGTGIGNKPFQRIGLIGMWYIKKFDITSMYFYGHDSAYLGTDTPANAPLPANGRAPSWNGALFESHYTFNPQFILINRYELVRMSQQAFTTNPSNLSNADVLTFGARYYPFISSRAGFAYHGEYSIIWQKGASPVTFTNLATSSLLFGIDFDF